MELFSLGYIFWKGTFFAHKSSLAPLGNFLEPLLFLLFFEWGNNVGLFSWQKLKCVKSITIGRETIVITFIEMVKLENK